MKNEHHEVRVNQDCAPSAPKKGGLKKDHCYSKVKAPITRYLFLVM